MDHDVQSKTQPLVLVAEGLMRKQLLDKSLSAEILNRSLEVLERLVSWGGGGLSAAAFIQSSADGKGKIISLYKSAQTATVRAVATAWFGDAIWTLSPCIVDDLVCLENSLWKLLFRLPWPCGRDVRAARARMQKCLVDYMHLPASTHGDRCWAVKTALVEMRRRGISEDVMASYLLLVLWGSNANTFKIAFWLLAHITADPTTLAATTASIDTITAESAAGNESISAQSSRLEQNPALRALYNETQRLAINSSSARTVEQDIAINGRRFKAGAHLLVPYRQLAMSSPSPHLAQNWACFQPDQFLSNPGLEQSKSFLPFGAGRHKCVGRVLSRRVSVTFAALLLHRFTVRALTVVPKMGFTPVSLGPGGPVPGGDMQVAMSQREC